MPKRKDASVLGPSHVSSENRSQKRSEYKAAIINNNSIQGDRAIGECKNSAVAGADNLSTGDGV